MKNIRPKYRTRPRMTARSVTPVINASSGTNWASRNGVDAFQPTRSSLARAGVGSMRSPYLPVGRETLLHQTASRHQRQVQGGEQAGLGVDDGGDRVHEAH